MNDNNKKARSLVMSSRLIEALSSMGIHTTSLLNAEIHFPPGELVSLRLDIALSEQDFSILGNVLGGAQ